MDWLVIIAAWIDAWRAQTAGGHVLNIIAGMMGGCLYIIVTANRVILPKYDRKGNRLELGFVGVLIAAAVCGFVADYMPPVGLVAGAVFPVLFRILFSKILPLASKIALRRIADAIDEVVDGVEGADGGVGGK